MDSSYYTKPLIFLIEVTLGLYTTIVLLRFLLQLVRADFYNPVSQFIVKATRPLLTPLRRVLPGVGGIDLSSLVLAWLVKSLELMLIIALSGAGLHLLLPLVWAIPKLIDLTIDIFLFAILIQVIISWVNPQGHNPILGLLYSLTEPILGPVRRRLPPMGGLDLSPMVVIIVLYLLRMLLLPPIEALVGQLAR